MRVHWNLQNIVENCRALTSQVTRKTPEQNYDAKNDLFATAKIPCVHHYRLSFQGAV